MDFRIISTNKSPFHDDNLANSNSEAKKSIRLPTEAFERINTYFEENDMNFSEGVRSLCYEKLDTICNERKTFNNLEVFMLIPKMELPYPYDEDFDVEAFTDNFYHILNTYSEIFAMVNTECDFRSDFNHVRRFEDDYVLSYELKEFKAENFPMHILQNTTESKVYRTHKGDLNSFHSFKDRLSEVFHDDNEFSLNVDDCYFVRFPLNNYLDVRRNGQFQQSYYSNLHEGVYVFEALHGFIKHYCFIDWSYSIEDNNIHFEIHFDDEASFLDDVYKTKDDKLINSALGVVDGNDRRKRLENFRNNLLDEVNYINHLLEDKSEDD